MSIHCYEKVHSSTSVPQDIMRLDYDQRSKSRGRSVTEKGNELRWFLERGVSLLDGDLLKSDAGDIYQVVAANEPVSRVRAQQPTLLTRVAYHLGNRHVALHVAEAEIRYQPDHVLDDMVIQLGLTVEHVELPFQPEDGAYHTGHKHD